MLPIPPTFDLEALRNNIAGKVRLLRKERSWTQQELANHLGLSQSRLSEIERGDGSLTAEQFLTILRIFNIDTNYFMPAPVEADLQNAMARAGALHLMERTDVVPSTRFEEVGEMLVETLVAGGPPRLLTALAPVLVWNIDNVSLVKARQKFMELGLGRRWFWLIENLVQCLENAQPSNPEWKRRCRRAQLVLRTQVAPSQKGSLRLQIKSNDNSLDIIDKDLRSQQSLEEVLTVISDVSKRWRILTVVRPEDFFAALRMAYESG